MAEEVAKVGGIYSVLTEEEVEAWVSSEGDPKLPSESITAAFRQAERLFAEEQDGGEGGDSLEINFRDIAIPRLSEILSELVWRVVGGELSVDLAISYLASDKPFANRLRAKEEESGDREGEDGDAKKKVDEEKEGGDEAGTEDAAEPLPLQEALCDTVWGVDVMVRGTVEVLALDKLTPLQNEQWGRLCSFVQRLHADELVPQRLLLVLLSDELLVGSKMVAAPTMVRGGKQNTPLARSMLKKGTEMVYKQHRFNLQREETEGFAKLLVLLAGVRDSGSGRGNAGADSEENMRRLIGYFDLDPNRALDLTLDALESTPANRSLLRLVGKFNKDSVPHVVGFKLAHYRNPSVAKYHRAAMRSAFKNKEIDAARYKVQIDKVTPRSLYVLIAVLLTTGTLSVDELLPHVSPGIATLAAKEKEYLADLETKISKAGNKVPKLDADGNMDSAASSASSDNAMSKLGSMGPLAMGGGGGYGGGMMGGGMGSGTLYGGRDRDGRTGGMGGGHGGSSSRDRDGRRDGRDGRDSRDNGRRQSGDKSAGVKANGSSAAAAAAGGAGDGEVDDDSVSPGADNQLYGVLEALLDLRAWTLASGLLARLTKQGIDPLRDCGVREAFKRLVKDSIDGLASRYPKPITLYPAGTNRGLTNTAVAAAGVPSSPVPSLSVSVSGMASDAEEAEAGEVTLPVTSKTGVSRSTMVNGMALPPTLKSPSPSNLKDLQRLPGYGTGFVKPETLSEAVGVLAPLLKIVGPYLGRDPTMFARVCRVLAAVNSRNPLNIVVKTSTSRRSSSSSSTSAAAKLAATKASAVAAAAASSGGGQGNKAEANGGSTGSGTTTTTTTNPAAAAAAAAAAAVAAKDPVGAKDATAINPLKAFHSLFGLSPAEARELHRRGEAQGGAGAGEAALKNELDRRKAAYVRVVLTVAPSLGMTHANPGMQQEVWNMLAELPYVDRFMLYGAWRGHGMEKYALGVKHPQYAVAEIAAGAEISRLIKMLTSDNVKDMARKLGKSSHSHPLLFAEKALNQLESYDNFISMVADSMKFVGKTLGLDCMAYTMVQHLCQSNRSFVSDSGLDLERWVTNLSTFAGLLHRKNPETDSKPLLSWAVRSLGEGGEPAMAAGKVLREVLHKAGGVQVLDGWSITQAQVDGKGGGDVLRQENASFGSTVKPIKRAKVILQEATERAGASLPLLVLPALQAGSLLYEGGSLEDQMRGKPQPHLKVLGHRADETHTTLLQAMEFVCSKAWIKSKCPTIKTLLTTYGLEPRVVFHIWRPVINENLIKCWFPKAGTKTEREQRDEAIAKRFIGELEASITELSIVPESSPLTAKLILIFWALSLPDVYIPTKKYAQVVTNMHEAKRRADSKLQQAEEEGVAMSKAERSRYMLDRKTSPAVASKLESEKSSQSAHVKRVKNKLREIKASLFAATDKHKTGAETIDAVLKHLVAPRMGMGPEEAYFCSKFFNTLHAIEAPNFNSLVFYSRSFEGLSSTLLCKTQYEAAGLGFFLKDLLENVKEWRKPKNEAIYKMEAGTKHGFKLGDTSQNVVEGKAPQLNHAAFAKISGEWSMQVTKAVMAAVASDEFLLIKCGLIMYNKLIETFPVSLKERNMLCLKLKPKTDKAIEPRDDIRVPCTRIVNQLIKQISDSPPDPVAPSQRPATASAKTTSAGGSGATSGKIAPVSTTTTSGKSAAGGGSQPSRGNSTTAPGSAAADGKASALSATAKPYVPAPAASGRGGSSSASSAATKQPGSQAGKRQQANSGTVDDGQVVKKEPASSAAAASTATASGVAKRAREGGESARLKPAKTARVAAAAAVGEQELGEIVSEKKAPAASSAGGGEEQHALATPRDSRSLRKPATASSSNNSSSEAASKAGGNSKPSTTSSTSKPSSAASGAPAAAAAAAAATGASSRQSSTSARATGGRESSGRKVDSKVASASGSGNTAGSSRGGRVVRTSSSTGDGSGGGSSNSNGVDSKDTGRRTRGQGEGDRERRDKSGRTSDADSRAKALASQDMGVEGPAAPRDSGSGSGTLSVRRNRDSRGGGGGGGAVVGSMSRTNSNSRLANGRGSGGAQQSEHDRPGGREATSRHGGHARWVDEDGRDATSGGGGGDAGGVRFEGPARAGGGQRTVAESSRSGAGAGSRGSKRGRSAEPERSGGVYDGPGSAEGDPSQAFDSKRMRQPDQAMMPQPEGGGGRRGSAKSPVDRWGRGYGGGGGGGGGGTWEREGPAAPSDANSGRYHDDLRHGGGGGGGVGRMQMPSHEVPDRPSAYEARGRGRRGRSGSVMDDGQDRGGGGGGGGGGGRGGGHRDARGGGGGREHPSDEDVRSRSSRDSKKSRGDRQRGGSNRDGDGGGGGSGSGRKDKKKASKSKKRKH